MTVTKPPDPLPNDSKKRPTCERSPLGRSRSRSPVATPIPINSPPSARDRKSTRLNSSHVAISYAVFCLKKKKKEADKLEGSPSVGSIALRLRGPRQS